MKVSGFTLVELVVILMVIGILAVVAIPRLEDQTFAQRSFHDQTLSALRYAQKSAIAQRRTVCVAFGANSVTLTIASAAGSAVCDANLSGPTGTTPYQVTAPSGVTYVATPANFSFNPLGQASATSAFQVSGVSYTISVEQGTGYVH